MQILAGVARSGVSASFRAHNNLRQTCAWRIVISPGTRLRIKEVQDDIWLVSFMDYDLRYFDLETRVLEPLENPFGPKVLPM
jgi:hypothetical protein